MIPSKNQEIKSEQGVIFATIDKSYKNMQLKISKPYLAAIVGVMIPLIVTAAFTVSQKTVGAQEVTDTTVDVHVYKKIDGDPHGYSLSDFAFVVTGGTINETLSHDQVIALPPGTYAVEELVPDGFVKSDWRVGWYGVGCDANDDDQYKGWITIEESDLGQFESPLPCEVNNQYRPTSDNGNGGNDNGVLVVNKLVVGTTTSPSDFNFSVNSGADMAFEIDGSNSLSLVAGTYDVVEVGIPDGYVATYDNCSSISLVSGATSTCTITNTYDDGNGGGNGTSTLEYKLEGYVWHDADQNGAWPDTENALAGWTVTATNGTLNLSTTTDATGYYYFVVEAGTWTLSEVLQEDWAQSFPSSPQTYVVTVPNGSVEEVTLWFPLNLFVKVAQAAIVETYSGFNFGNYYTGNGGGNGGNDDGGGDGGDGNDGGGSSGGSSGRATPKVLGEQLTLPVGAPNMGAGGASSRLPVSLAWLWPVLAWFGI